MAKSVPDVNIFHNVLKNVIRRGKGIEINTACMGSILEDTMPGMEILRMYKELGGRIITAGSDSHRPERIGYGFISIPFPLLITFFRTFLIVG